MRAVLWGVLLVGSSSCIEIGKSCTEAGCGDEAHVTLRPEGGEWVAGTYELSMTVDGVERGCAFHPFPIGTRAR